jgi:hypothetical protein
MSTQKRKRQSILVDLKQKIIDDNKAHPFQAYEDLSSQFSNKNTKLINENIKRVFRDKMKILPAIDDGVGAR